MLLVLTTQMEDDIKIGLKIAAYGDEDWDQLREERDH